jgi:hypothetical protein
VRVFAQVEYSAKQSARSPTEKNPVLQPHAGGVTLSESAAQVKQFDYPY